MEEIRDELVKDVNIIIDSVQLLEKLYDFTRVKNDGECTDYTSKCEILQSNINVNSEGIAKLKGTQILYLAGRFEVYIRNIFEESAIRYAESKGKYSDLPLSMQKALLQKTQEVVSNYDKYGYTVQDRNSFLRIIHENINSNDVSKINGECLSITNSNMRPKLITEMFKIIGLDNIWGLIGKQNNIKMLFDTMEDGRAKDSSMRLLDSIMTDRNSIAHPADTVSWPSTATILNYCEYIKTLSIQIFDITMLHLRTSR